MLRRLFRVLLAAAASVLVGTTAAVVVFAGPAGAVPAEDTGFGSNPGGLQMFRYAPAGLPARAPLVVAMHGCSQDARGYADSSGWLQLADRWRFALVLPQKRFFGCFTWFDGAHTARDRGEALSVKQMIDWASGLYRSDRARIYVTGLSAGGAMTAVLLATYPEVFAGGAIVAGLPYRCAQALWEAFTCMSPGVNRSPGAWGGAVRGAAPGPPRRAPVSLWHGTADTRVVPANLTELVEQWTDVHGVDRVADVSDTVAGHPRTGYTDSHGRVVVEAYRITGMAHGQPVAPAQRCGRAGAYYLDRGVCAAYHIGLSWRLGT